ncbi:hypothetical protein COMNV_00066 [Commensalibacter sp. Nvir]|uniref:phosphatidate cytidylyltransferase n=1 Tax=Commensalibacter sp. Nvir TaxID=3069817 RepID=UPI002D7209D6|nr:hypothetical protein COMNV_00066 [Commensalibacter sp. Nvir]
MKQKTESSWQDLPLRIGSALLIIPIAVVCIYLGGWPYIGLVGLVSVGMAYEWLNLFNIKRVHFNSVLFLLWPLVAYYAVISNMWWPAILIVGAFSFIFGPPLWLGSVLIGGAGISLLWLRLMTNAQMWVVFYVVLVVVVSDSCAYMVGKMIGGRKLIPSVSPGKTWSGAIGGLIGSGIVGGYYIFSYCSNDIRAFIGGFLLSILVSSISQIGDLAESKLKRYAGVKDSGMLIPGHGGVLDRFDALVFASIFMAFFSWSLPANKIFQRWGGELLYSKPTYSSIPRVTLPVRLNLESLKG